MILQNGTSSKYDLFLKPSVDKIFLKLAKKDKELLFLVHKKIEEIRNAPFHSYKFLKKPLQGFNRVHILNNFVLIFIISHEKKLVEVWHFAHRDKVYFWLPE